MPRSKSRRIAVGSMPARSGRTDPPANPAWPAWLVIAVGLVAPVSPPECPPEAEPGLGGVAPPPCPSCPPDVWGWSAEKAGSAANAAAPDSMDRLLGNVSESFFGMPIPCHFIGLRKLFVKPNILFRLGTLDGMPVSDLSSTAQDYLKLIWSATEWASTPMTVTAMAERLGVRPSTVSVGIKKLVKQGLVKHAPYGSIELTDAGGEHAVAMVRRHRLLETFLVNMLGYGWDEVHDEAEILEHAVSEKLIERIDRKLGHPTRDPHGDPIPTADGHPHLPAGDAALRRRHRPDGGHHPHFRRGSADAALLHRTWPRAGYKALHSRTPSVCRRHHHPPAGTRPGHRSGRVGVGAIWVVAVAPGPPAAATGAHRPDGDHPSGMDARPSRPGKTSTTPSCSASPSWRSSSGTRTRNRCGSRTARSARRAWSAAVTALGMDGTK